MNYKATAVCLVCLVGGFCRAGMFSRGRTNFSLHKNVNGRISLAYKNLCDAQDAINDRLDDITDERRRIEDEEKTLKVVSNDLKKFLPGGSRNFEKESKNIFKRLRTFSEDEIAGLKLESRIQTTYDKKHRSKRKKTIILGVVVGALVSVAGGFVLGSLFAKKRKEENHDSLFIEQLTDFMTKN